MEEQKLSVSDGQISGGAVASGNWEPILRVVWACSFEKIKIFAERKGRTFGKAWDGTYGKREVVVLSVNSAPGCKELS